MGEGEPNPISPLPGVGDKRSAEGGLPGVRGNKRIFMKYSETFDNGPGGWFGWISNSAGPKPLEIRDGAALSRSPWWIDYNHAPPGVGYLHLLYMLNTGGKPGEHQREVQGENQFTAGGYPTDFTNARMTLRLKGDIEAKGAQLLLLCQAVQDG